jgi:hypothetical protein
MAAWFMRRLRCADRIQPADGIAITVGRGFRARVAGEQFTLSRAEHSHPRRKAADTKHMIIETTSCTRERAGMR